MSEQDLDSLVDAFDDRYFIGKVPSMKEYVARVPESARLNLLALLIPIEVEYLKKAGAIVRSENYREFGVEAESIASAAIDGRPFEPQSKQVVSKNAETVSQLDTLSESSTSPESSRFSELKVGATVGRYKLLEMIGEGGMGCVWKAEQFEPIRRLVAVKVVRADMGFKEAIARFDAERQALAMMDHENIARVLDANVTASGNPYFVMELVDGIPIHKFCGQSRLGIEDRVSLMIDVCKGVQHAHQKGIVHRDLKPANILVSKSDGKAIPKVIDFGLAKALDHQTKLTDKTMNTQFGQVLGTLQYMSPEQAELTQKDVDTRTDVYSLGVVLYQLLTGDTPLENSSIDENSLIKVLEMIREQEVVRPSTRLKASGTRASEIAESMTTSPARLGNVLKGELDWVLLKALEIDRERRYDSATGFADDLQRFLDSEPVEACPPSTSYRLKKFVNKNRGLVTAVGALAALLVVGIAGTTYGLFRANQSAAFEKLATQNAVKQREVAIEERNLSRQAAKRSSDILELVEDAFVATDPQFGATKSTTAKEVLMAAYESLQKNELDDEGREYFLQSVAKSLSHNGAFEEALIVSEELYAVVSRMYGEDSVKAMQALVFVATGHGDLGDEQRAVELYEKIHTVLTAELGAEDTETLKVENSLGIAFKSLGDYETAARYLENVVSVREKLLEDDDEELLNAMNNLCNVYRRINRVDDAIRLAETTLARRKASLGKDHTRTFTSMQCLADSYVVAKRVEEAIGIYEELLDLQKKRLGVNHPSTMNIRNNLAGAYWRVGKAAKAGEMFHEVYQDRKEKLGDDHPATLDAMSNVGTMYVESKDAKNAVKILEQFHELILTKRDETHPKVLMAKGNLGNAYRINGQWPEAVNLYSQAAIAAEKKLGPEHPLTLNMKRSFRAGTRDGLKKVEELVDSDEADQAAEMLNSLAPFAEKLGEFEDQVEKLRGLIKPSSGSFCPI